MNHGMYIIEILLLFISYFINLHNIYDFRAQHTYYRCAIAMGDVYAMSSRCLASVISAYAVDEGRVSKHDKSKVVDRNVIIRQRKKARLENPKVIHIDSLYFDGKENKTMMKSGKFEKQDHIAMLSEPGHIFIAHAVASSKNAEDSEAAIIKGLEGVDVSNLRVISGDGTPSNTGHLRYISWPQVSLDC